MVDKVEAKSNLKRYEAEIEKYQSLSRGLMTRDEMVLIDKKITQLKEWSKNLKVQLNGT
ncbi:hypothetical protein [Acinetobacter sp. ANC 4558]|uniref:hypothetical protein n=1 Tax=Acinetobacter sp. ANC 4558 TaxID=1977876 RepID=UPI00148AACBD|nr:hypothetical protein [Acinetobacter sp. ANC 4558]